MPQYKLKEDWDTPISYPHYELKGHFCGRKAELDAIKSYLSRRDSSSVLIVGHRGVGKTSLLKKVFHIIKEENNNKKLIIPVFINGPQLIRKGKDSSGNIESDHLLKTLITRLYRTTDFYNKEKPLTKELINSTEELYKKAAASTFKDSFKDSESETNSKNSLYTRTLTFVIKDLVKFVLAVGTSAIALFLAFTQSVELEGWLRALIATSSFTLPAIIAYKSTYKFESKEEKTLNLSAEKYYFFDNDVANIEFDLEKIQEKYSRNGIKIVYVFDELDKVKEDVFLKVVDEFKNFFTLGHAHYLFVTHEKAYEGLPKIGQKERKENYTYFNNHFFLARPLIKDLKNFLDEISSINKKEISDEEKEILQNHLIFKSKGDFFDLSRVIQNHINEYENNCPIISFDSDYLEKMKKKSNFQKAIKLVFEEKYESEHKEKWIQNEKILSELYNFAHDAFYAFSPNQFREHSADDNYLSFSAKKDLGTLLTRIGYINHSSETDITIESQKLKCITYHSTFDFSNEVPTKLDFLSQWEEDYLSHTENFINDCSKISQLINASSGGDDLSTEKETIITNFQNYSDKLKSNGSSLNLDTAKSPIETYQLLKKDVPETFKNDFIQSQSKVVSTEIAKIHNSLNTTLNGILTNRIKKHLPNLQSSSINKNNITRMNYTIELDDAFKDRIVNQPNNIISNPSTTKHILIVRETTEDVFKGISKLYQFRNPEKYKFEYKIIVFGHQKKKNELFNYIDFANEDKFDSNTIKKLIDEIIEWFLEQ